MKWVVSALLLVVAYGLLDARAAPPVRPYRIVLLTEAGSEVFSEKVIASLKESEPYKSIAVSDLEFKIVTLSKAEMKCANTNHEVNDRLVTCDQTLLYIQGNVLNRGHSVLAVTASGTGGSGGSIPVVATDQPPSVGSHELGHHFGLGDEYEYDAKEAAAYCKKGIKKPNVVSFKPKKASFSSDREARSLHQRDIPWYSQIMPKTAIVTGHQLGSMPRIMAQFSGSVPRLDAAVDFAPEAALFSGGPCQKVIPTWHPYEGLNVMADIRDSVMPPTQARVILREMGLKRGAPMQLKSSSLDTAVARDPGIGLREGKGPQPIPVLPSVAPAAPPAR